MNKTVIDYSADFVETSCRTYEYEYEKCSKISTRLFNRYNGTTVDCGQFKSLLKDCDLWKDKLNGDSLRNIINYEKELIQKRMDSVRSNDVWEYREKPPSDWNAQLPEWAQERLKKTAWYQETTNLKEAESSK